MVKHYKHTQKGYLLSGALVVSLIVAFALFFFIRERQIPATAVVILSIVLFLFHNLTVEITKDTLKVWFGPGIIKKTFLLEEITSVKQVRNKWYYGWGVRLTPYGWMFNVSGFDAVEIELKNGKRFRIGTDESEKLEATIKNVIS